ncbi:MAG: His/Gly/Thr/Pro-type tRNA ligase C-terminal domain-containing protein [Thomasclavelia sp.]
MLELKETYTIEALMHDGKALQSGTSHYFGQGFAKAFDMKFLSKENKLEYVYQTSWGVSTRLLGAIIMVHGDNNGLVLPPRVAPIQVMIIPIQQQKDGVLDKAYELQQRLKDAGIKVKVDASDKTPGWKFSEAEMRGIPLRLEIGPKDIANNACVIAKRNDGTKETYPLDENLENTVKHLLDTIHEEMYQKALKHRDKNIRQANTYDEFKEILKLKAVISK